MKLPRSRWPSLLESQRALASHCTLTIPGRVLQPLAYTGANQQGMLRGLPSIRGHWGSVGL